MEVESPEAAKSPLDANQIAEDEFFQQEENEEHDCANADAGDDEETFDAEDARALQLIQARRPFPIPVFHDREKFAF